MSRADGLLSIGSWGMGAVSCVRGGPFLIPHFTSLSPRSSALCRVFSLSFTVVKLCGYKIARLFSFFTAGCFLGMCCLVLSEELVERPAVTREEC